MFIDQGESYPIAIHKKLLRAISPKIGNFARAIKSSRDHVCASADAIASDRSRKTKRPDFTDTTNPMCPANDGIEDTEHFLLLCPSLEVPRRDLLAGVSALLRPFGHTDLSNEFLMQIVLYGDKDFPDSLNKDILLLTLCFIHETSCFD